MSNFTVKLTANQVLGIVNQYNEKTDEIDRFFDAFDDLAKKFPDCKFRLEVPGDVKECLLKDISIYEGIDGSIVFDAE